jgi:hypothetical protein
MITDTAAGDVDLGKLTAGPKCKAEAFRALHCGTFPGIQRIQTMNERQTMRKQRPLRPGIDDLENKILLSAGVAPDAPTRHLNAAAVVEVARPPVQLMGYVYSGTGTVSPMGGVHGSLNLGQKVVTLANGSGSVRIKLTQVHKYGPTVTARAYQIMNGTGHFKGIRGHGHTVLTATKVGGRLAVWTETFYP